MSRLFEKLERKGTDIILYEVNCRVALGKEKEWVGDLTCCVWLKDYLWYWTVGI